MREVTGYYYMQMWRYTKAPHSIKVIAPERREAAETVARFLKTQGFEAKSIEEISYSLKPSKSVNLHETVIVADFYKEEHNGIDSLDESGGIGE